MRVVILPSLLAFCAVFTYVQAAEVADDHPTTHHEACAMSTTADTAKAAESCPMTTAKTTDSSTPKKCDMAAMDHTAMKHDGMKNCDMAAMDHTAMKHDGMKNCDMAAMKTDAAAPGDTPKKMSCCE